MALLCTKITKIIITKVLDPVDSWVTQQQQQCSSMPWPINWLCKSVLFLVKVTTWVTREIATPTVEFVCKVTAFPIGWTLLLIAIPVDLICQKCHMWYWTNLWLFDRVVLKKQEPSVTQPGLTDYSFACLCPDKAPSVEFVITAENEVEAKELADKQCAASC